MGLFATGVGVVTTQSGREMHGMTANAISSVSLDPLLVLVCLKKDAKSLEIIRQSGAFAISFLSEDQEPISRHFSGSREGREPEMHFQPWEGGPRLIGALGALGCTLFQSVAAGDHHILIGQVTALHEGEPGHPPLVFWGGRYREIREKAPVAVEPTENFGLTERMFYEG